jgi:hydroxymethylpyrimidine pyrophosphatase-like HAD family hydrolase
MLISSVPDSLLEQRAQREVLPAELAFYQSYDWCLNPYLTVNEAVGRLRDELDRLALVADGWQLSEVATNIFLLSCGLLNCIDEYLRGPALRLPSRVAGSVPGRGASRLFETVSNKPWSRSRVRGWREHWLASLNDFLSSTVGRHPLESARVAQAGRQLVTLLGVPLPSDLLGDLLGAPTPFNRLDLTQEDVLALGERFVRQFPDRAQSVLLVGLRTSGSYFAPLLKAFLEAEGYAGVALVTIEPNKGVGRREKKELERFAALGYLALILDDPPDTSRTALAALDIAGRVGFAPGRAKFVAPTHPATPNWFKTLPEDSVITLPPEQWHKRRLLDSKMVELRIAEYFRSQGFTDVSVVASRRADEFNARLRGTASDERGERLKRIFEVRLEAPNGEKLTKFVLAKSVGWGWLGYNAFLIGHRLTGYVPPILGLRDGLLYMEWIPQPAAVELNGKNNAELVGASASYVAARTRHLTLNGTTATSKDLKRHNNGIRLLAKVLSGAYGRPPADLLMRSRLGRLLQEKRCPCPTLIDGNMHPSEWICGSLGPLKTDYEHHGMGKAALNLTDPAYDLADAILNLELSSDDERRLITKYVAESQDALVEQRLFHHKLLAGIWTMNQVQQQLFSAPRGGDAQRNYNQRFLNAWNFLTVQTARYCGSLCCPRTDLRWRAPLIVLDIDGVLDRRLFGFPTTSAAGMTALSLLNAHEFSVVLNTARSAVEVKDYCAAYSLTGGVAEYGSYLYDAVGQRERVLISAEAARQLKKLRDHLRGIPGVFLDDRHQYSIRAYTYRDEPRGLIETLLGSARSSSIGDGALAPISTHIVHQLLVELELDRLTFQHTSIDTHIVAKEVNKGTGLVALRDWVLAKDSETIAVGDGEPDLAMFRVATQSFAPANIGPRRQARLLGCRIASSPNQRGLLEIVGKITHPDDRHCERCAHGKTFPRNGDDLFLSVLRAADQPWTANLLKAILDPTAFRHFIR